MNSRAARSTATLELEIGGAYKMQPKTIVLPIALLVSLGVLVNFACAQERESLTRTEQTQASVPIAAPDVVPQSSAEKFLIAGTLLDKDGSPARGKTLYFFFMQDGVAYAKLGMQAGVIKVVSPSGKSDSKGRFTIEVDPALIREWRAISTAFTIGFLNGSREPLPLTRNGVPMTFNFDEQGKSNKVDLGVITVNLK